MPRKQSPKRTRRNADQPAPLPVVTPKVVESPTVAQVIKADAAPVAPTAAPAPGEARPNRGSPPSTVETVAGQDRSGPRETTRTPVVLQHTALQVYRSLRKKVADPGERRQRAFAISTASLQNAGVFIPGSRRLTRYGRRIEREHVREDPEVLARKLRAYERMLRAGNFDQAVAEGRANGAPPEWFVTLEDNGVCEIESHWPDEARANGHRDQVDNSIRQGVWRTINGGSPTAAVRHRSYFTGQPRNNGEDIIAKIHETARKAADYRLHGAVEQAKHLDAELDHLMARAERAGQHDDAVLAEEAGREAARGRRNGQVEDETEDTAPRWIHLSPDVAQMAQHWWWGQGDPLYAVVSRHFAGLTTWDVSGTRTLIQATPDEIERLQQVAAEQLEAEGSDEEMSAAYSIVHDNALFDIGQGPERGNATRVNGRSRATPQPVPELVRMGQELMHVVPDFHPGNATASEIQRLHRKHFPEQYDRQFLGGNPRSNGQACRNPQHRRNGSHSGSSCEPPRSNSQGARDREAAHAMKKLTRIMDVLPTVLRRGVGSDADLLWGGVSYGQAYAPRFAVQIVFDPEAGWTAAARVYKDILRNDQKSEDMLQNVSFEQAVDRFAQMLVETRMVRPELDVRDVRRQLTGTGAGTSPRSNAAGWPFHLDVEAMDEALVRAGSMVAVEVTDWMQMAAKTEGAQGAARVLLLRAYDGQERDVPRVAQLLEAHRYDDAVAIAVGARPNGRSTQHQELLKDVRTLAEEAEVASAQGSYGLARRLRGTLHDLLEQATLSGSEVRFQADKEVERGVRAAQHRVGRANPSTLQMLEWDAAHTMSAEQNELLKRIWQCGYDMARTKSPRDAEFLRLNELAGELRVAATQAGIPVSDIEQAEEEGWFKGVDSVPRANPRKAARSRRGRR